MSRKGSDQWLAERIERWFACAARPLPWRRRRSAWRCLVAEIMLQQTQAARVAERFEAFMRTFPTPASLASASEQAVLAAWQGLGYYRRARLLRKAAIEIGLHHGSRVPRSVVALRELPGVGRYTAGAVASLAFGAREAICDGNVIRVILRLRGIALPLRDRAALERGWLDAESLVQVAGDPAAFNEGLMELGATICTPLRPRCGECPVRAACRARATDSVDQIPAPPKERAVRKIAVETTVVVDARRRRVLLEQRADTGMWASMWQTPEGILAGAQPVGVFRHLTTHRDFRIRVHLLAGDLPRDALPRARWVSLRTLGALPISNATLRTLEVALGRPAITAVSTPREAASGPRKITPRAALSGDRPARS